MTTFEVTLTNTYGKNKTFAWTTGRNGFYTRPINTERGFGDSHTDYADINNVEISGGLWRFFEGTLGIEVLYDQLNAPDIEPQDVLEGFAAVFNKTADDNEALQAWERFVSTLTAENV